MPFGAVQARGRPFLEPATQDLFRLRQTVVTEWVLQIFRLQVMGLWYGREGPDAESLGSDVDLPPPLTIMEIPPGASLELPDLRKTVVGDRLDNTPDRMIFFLEAVGDETEVRTRGRRRLRDVRSLAEVVALFPAGLFVQVHRSFAVNADRVAEVRRRDNGRDWDVKLEPPVNRVLPVGRTRVGELWRAYGEA